MEIICHKDVNCDAYSYTINYKENNRGEKSFLSLGNND